MGGAQTKPTKFTIEYLQNKYSKTKSYLREGFIQGVQKNLIANLDELEHAKKKL